MITRRIYTKDGRLADILALIQVLALDTYTYRSEQGLQDKELQGCPVSADSWAEIARQHPEFFRVDEKRNHKVSLVARHVLPKEENETDKPPLSKDFVFSLIQIALTLHDREVAAMNRFMPLWTALVGGLIGTGSTILTLLLKRIGLIF
ncbi:MAG TPA: hypothetical protein VFK06_05580 [Candidatus Angelobacter sp.]|nr:hypothetical protein [Candidatus Angelobacter sp.]